MLCWGGVGVCGELFWTGILGGRREGGVRSELWAPRIIKLGFLGLGYGGVGTKQLLNWYMLGKRWGLWRIILDSNTWGTLGRGCFKNIIKLGFSGEALGVVGDYFGLGYLGDAGEEVFEVKCGHRNYKTRVMLGRRWGL